MYIIYSKEGCVNCERAKALLLSKGIGFQEIDVGDAYAEFTVEWLRQQGVRQLPYIELENEKGVKVVGGLEELRKELF